MSGAEEFDDAQLVNERFQITDILAAEGAIDTLIGISQTLMMRAISEVITGKDYFHPTEVADSLGVYPGIAADRIRRLNSKYPLLNPYTGNKGSRVYIPTSLGRRVFGVFQAEEE